MGQFIALWAIFQKPLATIMLPKSPTFLAIFDFPVKFGQLFLDIWRHFTGHTARQLGWLARR